MIEVTSNCITGCTTSHAVLPEEPIFILYITYIFKHGVRIGDLYPESYLKKDGIDYSEVLLFM
jgi:hypothetical protein